MPYKNPEDRKAQRKRWLERNHDVAVAATKRWSQSERGKQKRLEWNAARLAEMAADKRNHRHGTVNGYNIGCRCDRCRTAHTDYHRAYNARKRQAIDHEA